MTNNRVPLSVLDLVLTSEGDSVATTLEHSVDLARRVEEFGYGRYWLAEHHLFPGGAGAASYLLAPVLARETTSIRLGTAVLIIDNYSPLHVAEIAGTIAELGGRGFDLGIGRAGPSHEQRASRATTTHASRRARWPSGRSHRAARSTASPSRRSR